MAHILVLLDSAKQGRWRTFLSMSIQESDYDLPTKFPEALSRLLLIRDKAGAWGGSMCLSLLFILFLSELTGDKCVIAEVINVHLQDMIYWHCLSEWRQTFASFRTPREFSVIHHTSKRRWPPEVHLSSQWCYQHRGEDSISSIAWKITGRSGWIPSRVWE